MNRFVFQNGESLVITFIASFLLWVMLLVLILLFYRKKISKEVMLKVLLSFMISYLVSEGLKLIFSTSRPFNLNGYSPLTITIPHSNGFPSSHSSGAVSLAVSLFFFNKNLAIIYLMGALVVASGRILANVHSLLDVLGGVVVGITSSFFVEKILFGKRIKG